MDEEVYYGPYKVIGITKLDEKTPGGGDIVEIVLEDGVNVRVPLKTFDVVKTGERSTLTDVQDKKLEALSKDVVEILLEYDLNGLEASTAMQVVGNKLLNAFDLASHLLWGGKPEKWVPGGNFIEQCTLLQADKTLKELGRTSTKSEELSGGPDTGVSGQAR